jgi:hypothetical protein
MSAQITSRGPVQLPSRSIVLLIMVLAILVVIVAASWWLGGTPVTPAGVQAAGAAQPMPSPTPEAVVVAEGNYLVGGDIPGGTYKGRATRAPAYWEISWDAQGSQLVERSGPLTGEYFSVEVTKGQYLHVVGAQLIRLK